jgi:glycosyltransferase involved in cell wall biosynthesis
MISLIIPAHNEADYLPYTLRSVWIAVQQVAPAVQLIVVDDASTDATGAIAAESGAQVVRVDLRQIAAVRNAGARAARGDLLVFLDADTRLPPQTLQAAWAAYQRGCIGGGCRVQFDQPMPWDARAGLRLWDVLSRTFRLAAGAFLFARRDAFNRVGGFDERFYAAEEIFVSQALQRLGPFKILDHPVITSARKLESHTVADHLRITAKTILTLGRTLRHRKSLDIWYGPTRGSGS